jgi:methionyl-tRNA formyltransferase
MDVALGFIGSGSLLTKAILDVIKKGYAVNNVFCPVGDAALPMLCKYKIPHVEIKDSKHLTEAFLKHAKELGNYVYFSINNRFIISDLCINRADVKIFNIHNGLVQKYRGVAEICVIAALVNDEETYGATLHQLLPGQKVDTGVTLYQKKFIIDKFHFKWLMHKSIANCNEMFIEHFEAIMKSNIPPSISVEYSAEAYSYKNLKNLEFLDMIRLKNIDIGHYSVFFKELDVIVRNINES